MGLLDDLLSEETYFALFLVPVFILAVMSLFPAPASHWMEFLWVFPLAIGFALVANTLGVSGAVLFVPFFVLFLPIVDAAIPVERAIKAGLITEFFGITSSSLAFMRFGLDDRTLAWTTFKGVLAFIVAGSVISFMVPAALLYFFVAGATVMSSYLLLHEERKQAKLEAFGEEIGRHKKGSRENVTKEDIEGQVYRYSREGYGRRFRLFSLGGLSQGISGAGIGELGVVAMIETGVPLHVAIGTTHLVVAMTSLIASGIHLAGAAVTGAGVPWNLLVVTVPGVVIGGQMAPYVAARIKTHFFEEAAAIVFLFAAAALTFVGVTLL